MPARPGTDRELSTFRQESWFLARCWKLTARRGVCGVDSFSDPVPRRTAAGELVFSGHVGTIYQASNAEYLGRTGSRRVLLLPDGGVLSERALSKVRGEERGPRLRRARARALRRAASATRRAGRAVAEGGVGGRLCVRSIVHRGNHRYGFRLGARRRLVAVGLPAAAYPKAMAA